MRTQPVASRKLLQTARLTHFTLLLLLPLDSPAPLLYPLLMSEEFRLVSVANLLALEGVAVPLLWQHGPGDVIGTVERLGEDARGLRVIGRVSARTAAGRTAAQALKAGAVDGLSFGYRVRAARGARPRELIGLELVEISLVTHPMQVGARVVAVDLA